MRGFLCALRLGSDQANSLTDNTIPSEKAYYFALDRSFLGPKPKSKANRSLYSSGAADKRGEQFDVAALEQRFSCQKAASKRSNRFETDCFWQLINGLSWSDPVGSVTEGEVELQAVYDANDDMTATVTLYVNGEKAGQGPVNRTHPGQFSLSETFDVGEDTGTPVSQNYTRENAFSGDLDKVVVALN